MEPSNYLKCCWLIITEILGIQLKGNFMVMLTISILDMTLNIADMILHTHLPDPRGMCKNIVTMIGDVWLG